uniref:Uncharacterized protein n=1 Tax=Latimeria chalumnae TaxID=7897 RepID=H3B4Q6_LATCH
GHFDIWRSVHSQIREHTFYSNTHKPYSRIDALYVSHNVLIHTVHAKIGSFMLSDHAPVNRKFVPALTLLKRFNNSVLWDMSFFDHIKDTIWFYSDINKGLVQSQNVLWDAFKGGAIISCTSNKKKQLSKRQDTLEDQLETAERAHTAAPQDGKLYIKLQQACSELQVFLDKNKEKVFFQSGDKAGALLAYSLWNQEAAFVIPGIKTKHGDLTRDPNKISAKLRNFYKGMYQSQRLSATEALATFLQMIPLPQSPQKTGPKLDTPL